MYRNATELENGETLAGFDVCIVGAGAAGIAMAQRLIGSALNVLVLESGLPADVNQPSGNRESIYAGTLGPFMQQVDPTFLTRSRLRMYGGTTNHFAFWARPLDEADLESRPGYRDAHWPINRAQLDPYYAQANVFGNYGPFNYDDVAYWSKILHGQPFPTQRGDAIRNGIFHSQADPNIHDFQLHYGNQLRTAENVTVLFNANVLGVESTEQRNHVTGLFCGTIEEKTRGKRFRVEAKHYVLAQGGIEPVRLLKLSYDLGDNAREHLGRGFMVHPVITRAAQVTFAKPVDALTQNFFRTQQVILDPPNDEHQDHRLVFTPIYHPEELDGYLRFNAWGVLMPTAEAMAAEQIGNFRIILGFDYTGQSCSVNINWEQVPNEYSTITLDENEIDPVFRQPVVRLDWNLVEEDKRTIVRGLELCRDYFKDRGANNFRILTDLSGGPEHWSLRSTSGDSGLGAGDHHMGALRMSESPGDGIVDTNLKLHKVDNLYVAGCGVFPTSGCANPTLTIVALALRLADHLKTTMRR